MDLSRYQLYEAAADLNVGPSRLRELCADLGVEVRREVHGLSVSESIAITDIERLRAACAACRREHPLAPAEPLDVRRVNLRVDEVVIGEICCAFGLGPAEVREVAAQIGIIFNGYKLPVGDANRLAAELNRRRQAAQPGGVR